MTSENKCVFILLEHGRGLRTWRDRYARGEVSEEVPYGYQISDPDWTVEFSQDMEESRWASMTRRLLSRLLGFDVVHVWRNRSGAKSASVVWTHTEHSHLGYSLLRRFDRSLPPALCQSIWIPEEFAKKTVLKRMFLRWLLSQGAINIVQSRENERLLNRIIPGREVVFVPFGISPDAFEAIPDGTGIPHVPLRVLGIGNDRHRNWELLYGAADRLGTFAEFRVLTKMAPSTAVPPTVKQYRAKSLRDVTDAYAWADVVCLPLKKNMHASGITVALESVFARRPLIMTNVGGLDAHLPHFAATALPEGATEDDWANSIQDLGANYIERSRALLKLATEDVALGRLDSKGYSDRLLDVSKALINSLPSS
jgi:glycosyltransferase involved in cell wall biosynthesis